MCKFFDCQDEGGARQETKRKRRFKTFKNGNFWQQDITPDGKSFITESKPIFWSNEMFLKAYDLFLFLGKNWIWLGVNYAGPAFSYRVSLKSNF